MKFLVEAKRVNDKKIVSTNIASMILRKYEQSVLQSLCLIFFHYISYSLRAKNIFACMSIHFFMLKMHLVIDTLKMFLWRQG